MSTEQAGNHPEGNVPVASSKRLRGKKVNDFIDEVYGKEGSTGRDELERYFALENIGEMLKEIRSILNVSQSELGEKIGVKRAQVSRMENNESNLTMATLLKFLQGLQVVANLVIEVPGNMVYKVRIASHEQHH